MHIGIWGQRHLRYLKENKRVFLSGLQISGKLNRYLADIDRQAQDMFEQLVKQMAAADGVTEQLKADNPMEWINKMNNIRNRGSEIVNTKIIFKQAAAAIDFTNIRFHLTIFKRYGCNICNEDSKSN